ncbi:MAG TPA: hypothetical protein VK607_25700 [Kofleriaceae bacterium]|nr:hypothetical protein [Kofleriaceae bacterium]
MISLNNGASRDFTNGAKVIYGNGASTGYPNGARISFANGAAVTFGNGASIGFGNGAAVQFPNGAPSATFTGGSQLVLPVGGTVKYLAATTLSVNGANVSYAASASATYGVGASLRFTNGANIQLPNGANIHLPNGAAIGFPNGAAIGFPNGAVLNLPNGASASYPSGASVVVGGYNTQAFLTSKLWMYPLGSYRLDPMTWATGDVASGDTAYQTYQKALYKYLQGALMKQNGDLPAGGVANDAWVKGDYDPYDLIAFKYLIRSAAKSTTSFTVSYVRTDGATRSEVFQGGLGVCEVGDAADWVLTPGLHIPLEQPFDYLELCGGFLSAAIGLFTQPVGINNSVSIRNLAAGDYPGLTNWRSSIAPALALTNLIQPLPRKRGVALDPFAVIDNRQLESMTMATTGNSGAYSTTLNTQGGWAGGYTFRCTGGTPVVMNLNKLKTSSSVIPGTTIQQSAANLVLRMCKGVHGCNKNDADWLTDNDDYSGSDVWPMASFTCGAGYPEVASVDYSKYRFVYSWLVRARDGNDLVSNGISTLCSRAPESLCRSTTANPVIATTNTAPATEAQIYTQREGLYFGDSFPRNYWVAGGPSSGAEHWAPVGTSFGYAFAPQQLWSNITASSVLFGNCDVRSVEPTLFGPGLPEPTRLTWTPPTSSFPGVTWPTSYRSLAHRAVSTDRNLYRREFCSSLVQTSCVPCMQATSAPDTSREGYLPMLLNGSWLPVNYSNEPWLAVAKDASWTEQPQYAGEAVPVEASYYNATRVCSQQYDRGNQGYCFSDWQGAGSCSQDYEFGCKSNRYRDQWGSPVTSYYILALWVPQAIQPTSPTYANRCPVGFVKGTTAGYTSRCFAPQPVGASCSINDQCTSHTCGTGLCR